MAALPVAALGLYIGHRSLTSEIIIALGGTRTPNLLIRSVFGRRFVPSI
jgi:hypothetical protein